MTFDLVPYLPQNYDLVSFIGLLTMSFLLIFGGTRLIRSLSLILGGLIGALAGLTIGSQAYGMIGATLGFAVGFALGGVMSLYFLPVGIGLAMGFMGYSVAKTFIPITLVPPLVGVVCFAYGLLLTDVLLSVMSATLGGMVLYDIALSLEMPPFQMLIIALAVSSVGAVTQSILARKAKTAPRSPADWSVGS